MKFILIISDIIDIEDEALVEGRAEVEGRRGCRVSVPISFEVI